MRARRSVGLGRVALVSFLFVAAAANASARQPAPQEPSGQKPEQKATTTTPDKVAPAPAADASANNAAATTTTTTPAAADSSGATGTKFVQPLAGPSIAVEQDRPVITHTDMVTLTVTVTDTYGRFVTGLGKNAFTVTDDKVEQDITFFSDEDAPVSLGVIFDVSGSMGGEKISKAREALKKFIETSHTGDEYFLIGFNNRAQLLLDRTRDSDSLMQKLTFVQTKGQTALYDACYLGVERVTRGAHPKRAVLLISDGQDNSSRYTFTELRRMLKESDVIIYAVGIVDGGDESALGYGGRAILEELAGVSGGKAFFPSTGAEMNDTFERIALELRTQYSIGFRPTNFVNNGKWHKLKIRVQPPRGFPRLFVRGREGYYATTNPR
jgi:Ca-activated chloride channel family protein